MNPDTVLVKPDVALRQIEADRETIEPPIVGPNGEAVDERSGPVQLSVVDQPAPTVRKTRRFWATVEIEPTAMATQPAKIGQEIVRHLALIPGARVSVTVDIQAEVDDGIPDDVRRVLNENSQTLKFKAHGFEES